MSWIDLAGLTGLLPESRTRLDALRQTRIPQGTALFHPGDAAQGFLVVLSGRVPTREQVVELLRPHVNAG